MKRKWFCIILILTCLTGCSNVDKILELRVCGSYAIPGMLMFDTKGTAQTCDKVETDSVGRTLFKLAGTNMVTGIHETYYVICQKIDSKYVYFYEDICYISADSDTSEIEKLKKDNCWNEQLDESKMSRRPSNVSYDLYIVPDRILSYGDALIACSQELNIELPAIQQMDVLDISPTGQEIYYVRVLETQFEQRYLVFIDPMLATASIEVTDLKIVPNVLTAFKQSCNWTYGFSK